MFQSYNKMRAFCFSGAIATFLGALIASAAFYFYFIGFFLTLCFFFLFASVFLFLCAGYLNFKIRNSGLRPHVFTKEE
jgi:hypothetical protein